jgi:putative oxidoreductase
MSEDGTSLPALIIRLAVGPTMFVHGYNKVFGSGGLGGTERWFGAIGFSPAAVHARMAATTEMTSGALITLGALNPLPSAAVIGVMTVAARSDHRGKGFFVFKGGWEYVVVLSAVAAALAGMGPGRLSVDHLLGNRRRGWKAALGAAVLGVGSGAAVLAATFHPEEEAEEDVVEAVAESAPDPAASTF